MGKNTLKAGKIFDVKYRNGKRYVHCDICNSYVERSIVTHLKKKHPAEWKKYIKRFAFLRRKGWTSKKIMWDFGRAFSWTVIDRALVEEGIFEKPRKKKIFRKEPENFSIEKSTVWSFKSRGNWAVHDSGYRGNWAPEVPRNLILKYTKEGDWVLDPFVGGGTTAIESILLGRNFIGCDINPGAITFTKSKIKNLKSRLKFYQGVKLVKCRLYNIDARSMINVKTSSMDLVCAHPPYLDIIEYTRTNPSDLSTITDVSRYLREMRKVSYEAYRCIKPGGYFCVLIGDVRRRGNLTPLGFKLLNVMLDAFDLEDIVIKAQHKTSATGFWKTKNNKDYTLAHEYLFIFKKPGESINNSTLNK